MPRTSFNDRLFRALLCTIDRARGVHRAAVDPRDQAVRDELIETFLLPRVPEVRVHRVRGAARELERERPVQPEWVHHAVMHAFAQLGDDVPEPRRARAAWQPKGPQQAPAGSDAPGRGTT